MTGHEVSMRGSGGSHIRPVHLTRGKRYRAPLAHPLHCDLNLGVVRASEKEFELGAAISFYLNAVESRVTPFRQYRGPDGTTCACTQRSAARTFGGTKLIGVIQVDDDSVAVGAETSQR